MMRTPQNRMVTVHNQIKAEPLKEINNCNVH